MSNKLFKFGIGRMGLKTKKVKRMDNFEERRSFLTLEEFLSKTLIMISPTFDSYMTGHRPSRRILLVSIMKLASFLFILRYLLSIFFYNNHYISVVLMSNANHLLGDKLLMTCVVMGGHLVTFAFSAVVQYFDLRSKLTVVQYLYEIKNLLVEVPLYGNYRTNYYKKMNSVAKHVSWLLLANMVLNGSLIILVPPVAAYIMEPEKGYSLFSIILWTPISFLAIVEYNATILGVLRFWFLSLTYLRYQFKQVYFEIQWAVKCRNYNKLRQAMVDHNYCCIKTAELNKTFNILIFIMLLIARPTLNVLVYITHAKDTRQYTRVMVANVVIICFLAIFSANLLCASITGWAHKPIRALYQFSMWKNIRVDHKLKALAMIEKLSESDIGFSNYKLYPMNNYFFGKSILAWASNYCLLIKLIMETDFTLFPNN